MDIYEQIRRLREKEEEGALAIVVNTSQSSPGRVSFKMIVFPDGKTLGTVGGGTLESQVIAAAKEVIQKKGSRFLRLSLKPEEMEGIGVLCGGEVEVYIESLGPLPRLFIFGAGHIGHALAHVASLMDFHVIVVDDRPDFANRERFPAVEEIKVQDFSDALTSTEFRPIDFVVIVTRGHAADELVLREVLKKPSQPSYIGMIGSKAKVTTVFQHLQAEGVSKDQLSKVYAPIGLNIGGEKPAEIAVSILAQIIAHRYGKL